ncbi:MAG: hypothetical protein IKK08_03295 [Clostridia bacterium]|nr:hypothetical protein [Clostridia bacterium]
MDEMRQETVENASGEQDLEIFDFFSCYAHSLDTKGRLIIPNVYREPLGAKFTVSITPDGEGIALYPETTFDRMIRDLAKLNRYDDLVRRYISYLAKMSYRCMETDSQGRLLIPTKLRRQILGDEVKEVEISGALDHVRICSTDLAADDDLFFKEHRAEMNQRISALKAEQ